MLRGAGEELKRCWFRGLLSLDAALLTLPKGVEEGPSTCDRLQLCVKKETQMFLTFFFLKMELKALCTEFRVAPQPSVLFPSQFHKPKP
jgi:hypothetical protein